MEERQEQQIEVTLRLPASLLGQLAAAIAGGAAGTRESVPASAQPLVQRPDQSPETAADESFDPERFRALSALDADTALPRRGRTSAEAPDLPARAAEGLAPELETPAEREPVRADLPERGRPVTQPVELPGQETAAALTPELPSRAAPEAAEPALPVPDRRAAEAGPLETAGAAGRSAWPADTRREAARPGGVPEGAAALSRRFERDSRRYDSGFPLY